MRSTMLRVATLLVASLCLTAITNAANLFHCPEDWVIYQQSCYRFFNVKHSWSQAAELCRRYGSDLVSVENFPENNFTEYLATEHLSGSKEHDFWVGLMSLNDLQTNTLESASGEHVSLYAGFWSNGQPNKKSGKCVKSTAVSGGTQTWELSTCEHLFPFVCKSQACPTGSNLCANGKCVNKNFFCDGDNDCGDASDEMDCPQHCSFYMTSSTDSLESRNYPSNYNASITCKWTLEGPVGQNIVLQFNDFETEKNFDTVQILTGGRTEDSASPLVTLSGNPDSSGNGLIFESASNFMVVKFQTDASVEKRGFRASWKSEDRSCGGDLIAASQPKELVSKNHPNAIPGGLECLYIIRTQPGRIITLDIMEFELNKDIDYMLVRDGSMPTSPELARLTGEQDDNPKYLMSTGPTLYVYVRTAMGETKSGYRIKYYSGCTVTLEADKGVVYSPAYGVSDYPNNQECDYIIKKPGGGRLSVKFNYFEVEGKDRLLVYDGQGSSRSIRLHPGIGFTREDPPTITLTADSGSMLIKFKTDPLGADKGWVATFSADCSPLKVGSGVNPAFMDTSFGSVLNFTCPVGSEFATAKKMVSTKCLLGGEWSIDYIPDCQEVYCGPVPQIDNGFSISASNVTYLGQATYQCYAGFGFRSRLPVETITCLDSGEWERIPECTASQCPPLPDTEHTIRNNLNGGGRNYGTVIRFDCEPGYHRMGLPVIHCMSNGSWSGPVPICSRSQCYEFPEIKNGFVSDMTREYYFEDETRVQCHRGYRLVGSPIIKCGPGSMFVDLPQCQDLDECASTQCDVTSTTCTNTPGAFFCKCKDGYDPNLQCRPMVDLGVSDGGIPDMAIMVSSTAPGYNKNNVRLNAHPGWCGANPQPNSNWVTVDLKVPTVIHRFRTQPVRRPDGNLAFASSIKLQYTDDLTDVFRDYTDNNGTEIEFRIATAASLFSSNLPTPIEARYIRLLIADYEVAPCIMFELMGCSRQGCLDKDECSERNGGCDQRCTNSPGDYACECGVGFDLYTQNGTDGFYIESSETGLEDGDIYRINKTCVPKMCATLESPSHGTLLDTRHMFHYGDIVSFHCNFGYVMQGAEVLACMNTGEWNGTAPMCLPAACAPLPEDLETGLIYDPSDVEIVPFMENVTISCMQEGRPLRMPATSGFRQCVYDLIPGVGGEYWMAGKLPQCPRIDCGLPAETAGAAYGATASEDTMYGSAFYFGCEDTFRLDGQSSKNDNLVRCMEDGNWDFGDLRCEGPVCSDPGHPADGVQIASSYEQGAKVTFECSRPGYIPISNEPIKCMREPECRVVKPLGITSGKIPSGSINATSERTNYESFNIRMNSATGWCGVGGEPITYVTVDLGSVHRIKGILVKGVITNDVVGRPTEIRLFYKESPSDKFTVYFPNFNLTAREPGNYGELAMITLPITIKARYALISIISFDRNPCLKFELMGCLDEPSQNRLLGYDTGYPICVDNFPPQFANCPNNPIVVEKGPNGILPVNFTVPYAYDNSGMIARTEISPAGFQPPVYIFNDIMVEYFAFDFDGNVAICQINITVPDDTPPTITCPNSYVLSLVEESETYSVNFNSTLRSVAADDDSGDVILRIVPDEASIKVGGFQNVTVTATDPSGNRASCSFQVGVQASICSDWGVKMPAHGSLSCLGDQQGGKRCTASCDRGFRFSDNMATKEFICTTEASWQPSTIVPDCVSEETKEASYTVTASVYYRANGAVEEPCLNQYRAIVEQNYEALNHKLSLRCSSSVGLDIQVLFQETSLMVVEDNIVRIDFDMKITPTIIQMALYNLCSTTLSLIYNLGVPSASGVIESLLSIPSTGNSCPAMRALNSSSTQGFTCMVGEILNEGSEVVPNCLHCPAGSFALRGSTECMLCEKGFYQDKSRQGSCKKCPAGTFSLYPGTKSVLDCIPVCGYGTYSSTGLVPCLNCPQNYFNSEPPMSGFKKCQTCPPDTFTHQEASPSQELCRQKCAPGTYSVTGLEPCSPCPLNYYQPEEGMVTCTECPTSNYTLNVASVSPDDCQAVQCSNNICENGGLCLARQHQIQCYCPAGFTGRFCEVDINECESMPCYNGGTCEDRPQGYQCVCPNGYSGLQCQDEEGDCKVDSCPSRAMCKDDPGFGNFECLCRSGYTGPTCNSTLNPCATNQCENSAICVPLEQGRFQCRCRPGWEGRICDINTNDCAEEPCLLGANCTDLINDFKCSCPPGFTGKRCHIKVDLCMDSPCMNGVCINRFFNHECICNPGWTGEACDINIQECESEPCSDGANCIDDIDDFRCVCPTGYTGKLCQHPIDDCAHNPCQNGGSCSDMVEGYTCECRPGFVGLRCDVPIDECNSSPCNPIGTVQCLDLDNMFKCQCNPGFSGEFCEIFNDECESNPCLNEGECVDMVNDFKCICPPGWTGKRCEDDIGGCESDPCLNNADCIDLFEDYFCVCPSGTDGKRCQVAPDRCVGAPCMNGAECQDFGSGLNCSCSSDFIGVGCQHEYDACEANVCQNGATCHDSGADYECLCAEGYEGVHCERNIQDCLPSSCPPGASCIDLTNDYFCKCPFNLTGEDCRKVINVNYELFLNDERKTSSASLITPFEFGRTNSFTLALWVQYTEPNDLGTFLTLYQVSSPHMATDRKVLLQLTNAGVAVEFGEGASEFINFRSNIPLNDGQWHHLALVWNGQDSSLTLTTDAVVVTHTKNFATEFMLPQFGWITLGSVDQEFAGYTNERGFYGRLARINVWDRALDYRIEIPKMVRSCMKSPVVFNNLIMRWNGYDVIEGNVERVSPATCGEYVCPPGYVGDCSQLKVDKTPPRFDHCPGDSWITAPNGSIVATWNEPQATDNIALTSMVEKSGYTPGQAFSLGSYPITYLASDDAGNSATCSFSLHVVDAICQIPADPEGGEQRCKDWGPGGRFKTCRIGCTTGKKFSQEVPDFYTCGPEGFWRPTTNPGESLVYPSCAVASAAQRVFKVKMQFPTSVICNDAGQKVLTERIKTALNKLNRDWSICTNTDETNGRCIDLDIGVDCARRNRISRSLLDETKAVESDATASRVGRQVQPNTDPATQEAYMVDITFPAENADTDDIRLKRQTADVPHQYNLTLTFAAQNDPVRNSNSNIEATIVDLIQKMILEENGFDVKDALPNVVPDPSSLQLLSEYSCPIGKVVVDSDCVECASGSYYSVETSKCMACEHSSFQNELGQVQCKQCPEISGQKGVTKMIGSRSVEDCKEKCSAGRYFDVNKNQNLCTSCGYGFYQPQSGMFDCVRCTRGQTTQTQEAVSSDECSDECESGFQLLQGGVCEMCPEGTYRTKGIHAACIKCPTGRTTQSKGAATIDECSVPICLAGTFFDMENRECISCPEGTYQSNTRQKTCMECPSGTWTVGKGSTSEKDCRNACAAQGNDMNCHEFADCIELEEKKFECQCKIGYNGNGTACTDSCFDYCRNSGRCLKRDDGTAYCECEGSFTGDTCEVKSNFAYIASGIAGVVGFIILLVLLIFMICSRAARRRDPKKLLPPPNTNPDGSQVNFYYGPAAHYAESIAPSHHSTYAHYYDDEEDAWEMPNFYNETYAKTGYPGNTNSLARSNASIYGNKEDLYDRLRKHAYQGKKEKDETGNDEQL